MFRLLLINKLLNLFIINRILSLTRTLAFTKTTLPECPSHPKSIRLPPFHSRRDVSITPLVSVPAPFKIHTKLLFLNFFFFLSFLPYQTDLRLPSQLFTLGPGTNIFPRTPNITKVLCWCLRTMRRIVLHLRLRQGNLYLLETLKTIFTTIH